MPASQRRFALSTSLFFVPNIGKEEIESMEGACLQIVFFFISVFVISTLHRKAQQICGAIKRKKKGIFPSMCVHERHLHLDKFSVSSFSRISVLFRYGPLTFHPLHEHDRDAFLVSTFQHSLFHLSYPEARFYFFLF